MGGDIVASPSLIMLTRLAVKKAIIIKCRFIIHFVYTFPFQFLLLLCLYPLIPALQNDIAIIPYIAFSIIWLSFGFYAGYLFFASEADSKSKLSPSAIGFLVLGITIVALFLFTFFQLITGNSIFYWTVTIANKWPFVSTDLSFILAIAGVSFWFHSMRKTMDQLDYL